MDADNANPPAASDSAPLVCIECGTDLSGVRIAGGCPQCREPVAHSLTREHLQQVYRGWLVGFRSGTRLLVLSAATVFICLVGQSLLPFEVATQQLLRLGLVMVGMLVGVGGGILGVRMLTAAEPGSAFQNRVARDRLRRWLWLWWLLPPASTLAVVLGPTAGRLAGEVVWMVAAGLGLMIVPLLLLNYLQMLTRRTATDEVSGFARMLMGATWVLGGFWLVLRAAGIPGGCFGPLLLAGGIGVLVGTAVALVLTGQALHDEIERGRAFEPL